MIFILGVVNRVWIRPKSSQKLLINQVTKNINKGNSATKNRIKERNKHKPK